MFVIHFTDGLGQGWDGIDVLIDLYHAHMTTDKNDINKMVDRAAK